MWEPKKYRLFNRIMDLKKSTIKNSLRQLDNWYMYYLLDNFLMNVKFLVFEIQYCVYVAECFGEIC